MKIIYNLLAVVALLSTISFSSSLARAADYDTRVRFQAKNVGDYGGVSGIVELPNLSSSPGEVLVGGGYGIAGKKYEIGFHLAGLTLVNGATALVDVRGTVNATDNLYGWVNIRLLGLEDEDTTRFYSFGMVNYKLPSVLNFLALGVETENSFDSISDNRRYIKDYGIGPNTHIILSSILRIEISYQIHSEFRNQGWARLNIAL